MQKARFDTHVINAPVSLFSSTKGSIASSVESSALSLTGKAVLTHAELTVDIQNILTAAMSDDG